MSRPIREVMAALFLSSCNWSGVGRSESHTLLERRDDGRWHAQLNQRVDGIGSRLNCVAARCVENLRVLFRRIALGPDMLHGEWRGGTRLIVEAVGEQTVGIQCGSGLVLDIDRAGRDIEFHFAIDVVVPVRLFRRAGEGRCTIGAVLEKRFEISR